MRRLFPAGHTPGRPEIEQHNFPSIRRQLKRLPIQLRKSEIGRNRMHLAAILPEKINRGYHAKGSGAPYQRFSGFRRQLILPLPLDILC
jgi:hypothetical protein